MEVKRCDNYDNGLCDIKRYDCKQIKKCFVKELLSKLDIDVTYEDKDYTYEDKEQDEALAELRAQIMEDVIW